VAPGNPTAATLATLESPVENVFRVVSDEDVSTPEPVPEHARRGRLRTESARIAEWGLGRGLGCR